MRSFLCLICLCCFAVSVNAQIDLKTYVNTMPPNVASFEKYGNVPINYNTGQVSQSIPIYTFQIDENVSIPIELNYSNTGLKPGDVPTWVGNGWDLMPGGYIMQQIRGVDDFQVLAGLRNPAIRQKLLKYMDGTTMTADDKYTYIKSVMQGLADTQQDMFSLSLFSKSSKFYYDGDKVNFVKYLPYTVDYNTTNAGFTVTDEKGYKFIFGVRTAGSGSTENSSFDEYPSLGGNATWCLSKIITPDNNEVTLEYETDALYITNSSSANYTFRALGADDLYCTYGNSGRTLAQSGAFVVQSILKRITYKGRKVEFNTITRNDLLTENNTHTAKALSSIVVTNEQNQVVKNVSFTYNNNLRLRLDKLSVLDNVTAVPIQEFKFDYYKYNNVDVTSIPLVTSADHTYIYAIDHWGYYNGVTGTGFLGTPLLNYGPTVPGGYANGFNGDYDRNSHGDFSKIGMLQRITYPTGGSTELEYEPNQMHYSSASGFPVYLGVNAGVQYALLEDHNITCNESYLTGTFTLATTLANGQITWDVLTSDAASIASIEITSPDGTSSYVYHGGQSTAGEEAISLQAGTYKYILNAGCQFAEDNPPNHAGFRLYMTVPTIVAISVGGNRIARIRDIDSLTGTATIRKFVYENEELNAPPEYMSTKTLFTNRQFTGLTSCGLQYILGANNLVTYDGFHISYRKVTEYFGDNGENGKNVYTYDAQSFLTSGYTAQPFGPVTNFSWRSGIMQKKEIYKKSGTDYILKHTPAYVYTPSPTYSSTGMTQGVRFGINGTMIIGNEYPSDYFKYFSSAQIYMISDRFAKSKVTDIEYVDNGTAITKETSYGYTDKYFLESSVTEKGSSGKTIQQYTWYPENFNDNLLNMTTLKANNMIGLPLKTAKTVDGKIVSGEVFKLNDKGGITDGYVYESSTLQTLPVHDPANYYPTGFTLRNTLSYNTAGKVREFKKEDATIVILWGYNNTYPIAEIKNATYQEVVNVLGQTLIDQLEGVPGTDAQVRTSLNVLRTDTRLVKAQVNTYTYSPLTGMTSQTDPAGRTSFYEFDGFGRLKLLRGQDGNILKVYDYQYKKTVTQ